VSRLKQIPQLDDAAVEDLKDALIYGQRVAEDEDGRVLVWTGDTASVAAPAPTPAPVQAQAPLTYTPPYLAEKILTSRSGKRSGCQNITLAITYSYGVPCRHGNTGCLTPRHLGTDTPRSASLYWNA
jgi:hypothetical protein